METKYIVHVLYNTPFFTSKLYITLGITIFYSIIDPTLPTLKILHLYSQQMYLQKNLGCVDPIVYVYFISVNIEMQLHHNPIPSAVICLLSNCYTRWSEKFGHPWHQCCTHLRWEYFVFVSFRYRCLTRLGLFWAIPSLSSSYSSSAGGWEAVLGLAFLFLGRLVSVLVFGPMSWNWNAMTIHRKHIKYWSEWHDNRFVKGAFHQGCLKCRWCWLKGCPNITAERYPRIVPLCNLRHALINKFNCSGEGQDKTPSYRSRWMPSDLA